MSSNEGWQPPKEQQASYTAGSWTPSISESSSHSNRNIYLCLDCRQSFHFRADYDRHRKRHDRPFKCTLCLMDFGLKVDLHLHMAVKHETLECSPGCKTKTAPAEDLCEHMKEALLEKMGADRLILSEIVDVRAKLQRRSNEEVTNQERSLGDVSDNLEVHRRNQHSSMVTFEHESISKIPPKEQMDNGSNSLYITDNIYPHSLPHRTTENDERSLGGSARSTVSLDSMPSTFSRTSVIATVWTWIVASFNFLLEGSQTIPVKLKLTRPQKCGHLIYDDFIELKPGAAERYRLERMVHNTQPGSSSPNGNRHAGIFSSMSATIRSIIGPSNNAAGSTLPMHDRGNTHINVVIAVTSNQQINPPIDLLYLLICYREGRFATRLLQTNLTSKGTGCDQSLFKLLRSQYQDMRGKFVSRLSLRNLQSIKFVSFELFGKELVNLRKQDDIPPPGNTDYRYKPTPTDLIPPVGENTLMHLFEHPEEGENVSFCLDRFPKKLHEKLLCRGGGTNAGWGLQFVEGWNMRKIFGSVFFLFAIGSLLIGILWSAYEHSIQDAFSMASYMVAMATMGMGTLQVFLNS
ncbi:hypothetical protein HYFRA_00004335 [Hymenoscyphus fraxineus]|uniref:C2H2-type domain-containing protein n=1 Tax=Hymenoscyphus fraxineus TaxID=746836 RepID=A0A9N9PQ16_9HELO|nr:hypothetical protein HYFRA_00004335 [Hymenoscyphus fraxineus]